MHCTICSERSVAGRSIEQEGSFTRGIRFTLSHQTSSHVPVGSAGSSQGFEGLPSPLPAPPAEDPLHLI